jgi:hypothetical protein
VKKTFAVIAAVLFVLSFAASAFAIHAEIPAETQSIVAKGSTQITIGGEIRVRGWWTKNRGDAGGGIWDNDDGKWALTPRTETYSVTVGTTRYGRKVPVVTETYGGKANKVATLGNKFATDTRAAGWYDERVRLYVDAQVAPNVRGYVMLESQGAESESSAYGRSQWDTWSDKYAWGNFNSHPSGIAIAEAWILYNGSGLFGFNSGLKIGHMPLKLGEGQFFDHTQLGDDAIVFFMDPTKQIHIGLLAVKFSGDGNPNSTAYSPILPFGQGNFLTSSPANASALGGYSTGSGSLANNTDDLDGYVALMTYKIDDKNTIGINYTYLNKSDIGFKLQNLGVHANGSFGNFGYAAEADFQFGKVFDASTFDQGNSKDMKSSDYEGWAVLLKGNYKMNAWNFRASFAYGSGDDDPFDHSIGTFIPFVGSVQNYTFIYDYLATTTAGGTGTGLANTTYYNLGVDYAATKDLSFSLDGFILRASETWKHSGISKDAGYEIDGKMKYQIAKNLTYQIDAGYFKSGNFYSDTLKTLTEMKYGDPCEGQSIKTSHDKGMTVLRNMITLSF